MFITFEGGEGSGKSTVAYEFWKRLQRWKENAILTREPGGTEIAEKIREVVVSKGSEEMDIRTEVLLFAAARREHLVKKIIPALEEGKVVVCDRFLDSSIAYQGSNRWSGGVRKVMEINDYITADVSPDMTFLLDIDPAIALARIHANGRETNRFDLVELQHHYAVQNIYRKLAIDNPNRFVIIDATKSQEEVLQNVLSEYEKRKGELK